MLGRAENARTHVSSQEIMCATTKKRDWNACTHAEKCYDVMSILKVRYGLESLDEEYFYLTLD